MKIELIARRIVAPAYVAVAAMIILAPSADAGIFRRMFRPSYCPPQQTYSVQQPVQGAPAGTASSPQYQSFSYEPGTTAAAAQQAAPQAAAPASGSYYKGSLRYESGNPVPNLFRGDAKVRGLQRN